MRPRSLKTELLIWLLLPLSAVALLNLWSSWQNARSTADLVNDGLLRASATAIAEQVQYVDGHVEVLIPPSALEMFGQVGGERVFYRVMAPNGALIAGRPDLAPLPVASTSGTSQPLFYSAVYEGEELRAAAISQPVAGSQGDEQAAIVVAATLHARDALVWRLWRQSLNNQMVLLVVVGLLAVFALNRALRPILSLSQLVAAQDPSGMRPIPPEIASSELQPLVRSLNQAFARVDAYVAAQRRFIANASHQLRTPLTLLRTQAHVGLSEPDAEAKDEVFWALAASVDRLTRVANQLLTLARAESGGSDLRKEGLDFALLVREVLERVGPIALKHDIELEFDGPDQPLRLVGHDTLLREMVSNLVENAILYTPPSGTVRVKLWQQDSMIHLNICDSGPGIPEAERDRVFERFYRLPRAHEQNVMGTGLGLAVVREIAHAHGASIRLRDGNNGIGLLAEVCLPETLKC